VRVHAHMQTPIAPSTDLQPLSGEPSLRDRIIAGSLWFVAMRWMLRSASVVRTVILARLLVPADFGLLGMALLVVQPLQILTALDVQLVLIRTQAVGRAQFDSAWTLRALQRLLVAVLLFLVAPLAAEYFAHPELTAIVRCVALSLVVFAFENIGTVTFRRDFNFSREVTLSGAASLITLCATIIAALVLRNYWALVVSVLAERCVVTVLSYVYHPYRPRFSLRALRELWPFSRWIPLQNFGLFVKNSLDSFLVARFLGATPTGLYTMAGSAAALTADLLAPVSNAVFPGYARVANDVRRLGNAYLESLGMLALLFMPGTIGIVMTAPTLVPVVLGAQWMAAVPIVQALAIYNGINGLSATVSDVLMAAGRMRRLTLLVYAQLAAYAPVLLLVAFSRNTTAMALARALVALAVAPFLFRALTMVSAVDSRGLGGVLWRPLVASLIMAGAVAAASRTFPHPNIAALAAQVAAGIAAYSIAAALLWLLSGRPPGAERSVLRWGIERWRGWRERGSTAHSGTDQAGEV
jgi:O-antigen/teichoic acid export membrane protein